MSADAIRLKREFDALKSRVDALEELVTQLLNNTSVQQKKLALPRKDGKPN